MKITLPVLFLGLCLSSVAHADDFSTKQLKHLCSSQRGTRERAFCEGYFIATIENRRPIEARCVPADMSTNQIANLVYWWMDASPVDMRKYDNGPAQQYLRVLISGAAGC